MNAIWKVFAKIALDNLHKIIDNLTDEQIDAAVDKINAKIGGDKRIESASLKIIIQAARAALDIIKF